MKQEIFKRNAPQVQKGALLIESMVALTIFSIALLSLSSMQINASKGAFSSLLKTESAISSSEIIDKMRINLAGVAAGDYNRNFEDATDDASTVLGVVDIEAWISNMQNNALLGAEPDGQISCGGLNGLNCQIQIRWSDARAEQGLTEDEDGNTDYDTILYTFDVNL